VIGYLEQLERDLVEAIDRREAGAPAPRPRRPLRPVLVAAVALLIGIGIGLGVHLLGRQDGREIPALPPKPTVAPTPPPLPGRGGVNDFQLRGNFVQFPDGSWRGVAAGTAIRAAPFRITGRVEFRDRAAHIIQWSWTTPDGRIAGCVTNTTYRRPGKRWVWDGTGNVKSATGRFARWRGIPVGFGGRTYVDDRSHAYLALDDLRPITKPGEPRRRGAFDC
jgi:hypothetical protein